ncbi:MAG: tetratricopeptide repeat protein, partial [Bacteroidota bacterium]
MDSARYYYRLSRQKFEDMGSLRGKLFINHALASLEKKLGNYDQALGYYEENIGIYQHPDFENSDLKGFNKIGAEYQGKAEIYKEKGNYRLAVEQCLKALRFFEEIEHTRRIGYALQELGVIEYRRKHYEDAIAYSKRAYTIFENHDYHEYRGQTAIDLGNSYMAMENYDLALEQFEDALQIGREHKFIDVEAAALAKLGIANRHTKNYSTAQNYLTQAMSLHEGSGFRKEKAEDLNELASLALEMGNSERAVDHTSEAIQLSEQIGSLPELSNSYLIRSVAHETQGNKDLSLEDYKQYSLLKDSIFNTTKSQQIEELRTIYDTEKKEQQIVLQEQEIDLLEQKAEISRLQQILMGGALLLSLLGFYGIRQRLKRNKAEKAKVDAELAFKKKELTTHALHLARKNETLESLKQKAKELKANTDSDGGYQQLIRTINFDLQDDNNWENFARYFEDVHKDFNSNVKSKFPQVTSNELRLMALLKMNLSSKQIANILNISQEGIKKARYRLRKKLDISSEESLQDMVLSL